MTELEHRLKESNIRYYKDLHYLRHANINMSHGNAFILLHILYRKYDVLGDKINKTLGTINPTNYSNYEAKDNLLLDEVLTSDLKLIKCENAVELVKHIRTLIKKNHQNVPYNILTTKITKYTKIKDISKMLIFGV